MKHNIYIKCHHEANHWHRATEANEPQPSKTPNAIQIPASVTQYPLSRETKQQMVQFDMSYFWGVLRVAGFRCLCPGFALVEIYGIIEIYI